jgi:hypothetical protein
MCDKSSETVYAYENIEMCEHCFKRLISVMKYKNYNDIIEEDRLLLQKFCNNLVNQLFVETNKEGED